MIGTQQHTPLLYGTQQHPPGPAAKYVSNPECKNKTSSVFLLGVAGVGSYTVSLAAVDAGKNTATVLTW